MGGFGSGNFRGVKMTVEDHITLTSSWMLQNRYLDLAVHCKRYCSTIAWPNYRNEQLYEVTFDLERTSLYEMRLVFRNTGQLVFHIS